MKFCLLLAVLVYTMSVVVAIDYGLGILVDSSKPMLLKSVKNEFPRLSQFGARQYSIFAASGFSYYSEQNHNAKQMETFMNSIQLTKINTSDLGRYEYFRLSRVVDLVHRDSIILYFTDTIHSFTNGYHLRQAAEKRIVIYYFLTNCCLQCSAKEIGFRKVLKIKGHGVFCIMKSDIKKIFILVAKKTNTQLHDTAVFTQLLRKESLAFSIDVSLASNLLDAMKNAISNIAAVAKNRFITFGVFTSTSFFKFLSAGDVRRAFAQVDRLQDEVNDTMDQTAFSDRLLKSVELSKTGSVVFSITSNQTLLPNVEVREMAKAKDVVIHSFLTECAKQTWSAVDGFGVFCVSEKQLQQIANFIYKISIKRPFNITILRQASTFKLLLDSLKVTPVASTTTTLRPRTQPPKKPPTKPLTPTKPKGKPVVDHHAIEKHHDHNIIVNNNFNFTGSRQFKPQPIPQLQLATCDGSSIQLPGSVIFFTFTIVHWSLVSC